MSKVDANELHDRFAALIRELDEEGRNLPENEFRDRRMQTINGTVSGVVRCLGILHELAESNG